MAKILVIDDQAHIRNILSEFLKIEHHEVDLAESGKNAMKLTELNSYDLVITDLRMPALDGFAVLGWIRDFRPGLLSSVLVITGDSGGQSMDQELLDFGVPTLGKPFAPSALIEVCQKLLIEA